MAQDFTYRGDVVVFDLDDTLASERLYCRSGFRFAADWLSRFYSGLGDTAEVVVVMDEALNRRKPHYDSLERWLESKGGEVAAIMPELVRACRAHVPDNGYKLTSGARDVLERLRRKGVRMGLITDGRSITQREKIKALSLDEYFAPDAIFISEEQGRDKNSPESFEAMVHLFPEARRFWYVGDNPEKDFRWPNLLGWNTVCIRDVDDTNIFPQQPKEFPYAASMTIDSISDLPAILERSE